MNGDMWSIVVSSNRKTKTFRVSVQGRNDDDRPISHHIWQQSARTEIGYRWLRRKAAIVAKIEALTLKQKGTT